MRSRETAGTLVRRVSRAPTGCRSFSATYSATGNVLSIGEAALVDRRTLLARPDRAGRRRARHPRRDLPRRRAPARRARAHERGRRPDAPLPSRDGPRGACVGARAARCGQARRRRGCDAPSRARPGLIAGTDSERAGTVSGQGPCRAYEAGTAPTACSSRSRTLSPISGPARAKARSAAGSAASGALDPRRGGRRSAQAARPLRIDPGNARVTGAALSDRPLIPSADGSALVDVRVVVDQPTPEGRRLGCRSFVRRDARRLGRQVAGAPARRARAVSSSPSRQRSPGTRRGRAAGPRGRPGHGPRDRRARA